jgi:leucyl/phenylalanyl-tRNA--protein transferase
MELELREGKCPHAACRREQGENSTTMTDWLSRPKPLGATRWSFPPAAAWPDEDLVAIGGDLEPATLISAYCQGIFPMVVDAPEPVLGWWSPEPRGILPLDEFHVTHSMRQSAKRFEVTIDRAFDRVIRACADPSRDRAWINDDFVNAYSTLHALGWAHSVEVFDRNGQLAGGLYGVRVNGLFAGESMFHLQRDASKVALMGLVELMRRDGMRLLDVQWRTDHLASLGAVEVRRARYLTLLAEALEALPG